MQTKLKYYICFAYVTKDVSGLKNNKVKSKACNKDIDKATIGNKRMAPIVHDRKTSIKLY